MAHTVPNQGQPRSAGTPFGPFLLLRRLGAGGMAETFVAERRARTSASADALTPFGRAVCLKLILPEHFDDPSFKGWFLDEARIHSHLHHDNIVQVYDFGELQGRTYLVLEYVEGCDLRRLMAWQCEARAQLPEALVVAIAHELASALDYAHRLEIDGVPQRLVHRDVSPHNVLLSRHGHCKLCDFGVVKAHSRTMRTETGGTKGKVPYMSPEQLSTPERVDGRTDLFALGVIMFELLTRQHPFRVTGLETDMEIARRIFAGTRASVLELASATSPALAAIVEQLLATDIEARVSSAAQLMTMLEEVASPNATSARELAQHVAAVASAPLSAPALPAAMMLEEPAPAPPAPTRGRFRASAGALTALAIALSFATLVGAMALTRRSTPARVERPPAAMATPPALPASPAPVQSKPVTATPSEPQATEPPVEAAEPKRRSSSRHHRAALPVEREESTQPLDAWLDIRVAPDGRNWRVWVDGQYQGTSDVRVKVSAGKHMVAVGVEEPDRQRTVHVSSQSTRSVSFKSN